MLGADYFFPIGSDRDTFSERQIGELTKRNTKYAKQILGANNNKELLIDFLRNAQKYYEAKFSEKAKIEKYDLEFLETAKEMLLEIVDNDLSKVHIAFDTLSGENAESIVIDNQKDSFANISNSRFRWYFKDLFAASWNDRTFELYSLLPTGIATIVEFGAGNQFLEQVLPQSINYIPTDIFRRNEATIIFDLNCDDITLSPKGDAAIMSGVLEYLLDVKTVIGNLAKSFRYLAISYNPITENSFIESRIKKGWQNHLTAPQLERIFCENKWQIAKKLVAKKGDKFGGTLYLLENGDLV